MEHGDERTVQGDELSKVLKLMTASLSISAPWTAPHLAEAGIDKLSILWSLDVTLYHFAVHVHLVGRIQITVTQQQHL